MNILEPSFHRERLTPCWAPRLRGQAPWRCRPRLGARLHWARPFQVQLFRLATRWFTVGLPLRIRSVFLQYTAAQPHISNCCASTGFPWGFWSCSLVIAFSNWLNRVNTHDQLMVDWCYLGEPQMANMSVSLKRHPCKQSMRDLVNGWSWI